MFLISSGLATFDSAFLLTISINKGMVSIGNITPYHNFFLYPITNAIRKFSYTSSIYTIVGLSLERYLSFCHPQKAKRLCSPSKAKLLIAIITLVSFLYTIPIFCEHTWEKMTMEQLGLSKPHWWWKDNPEMYTIQFTEPGWIFLFDLSFQRYLW